MSWRTTEGAPRPRPSAGARSSPEQLLDPVGVEVAARLLVGPPDRQISRAADLVVHDRVIPDRRSGDRMAAVGQRVEQPIEVAALDDVFRSYPRYYS